MRFHRALCLYTLICANAFLLVEAQNQEPAQPPLTLADIARQNREKQHSNGPNQAEINRLVERLSGSSGREDDLRLDGAATASNENELLSYEQQIRASLAQKQFDILEKSAQDARSSKARFVGGVWQLYAFYEALEAPASRNPTQADWNAQLAILKEWSTRHPDSITAPVALATAYIFYAWAARGNGVADTVTEEGWAQMGGRVAVAKSILMNASRLSRRCPYWYEAMQQVALAQGWDKSSEKALFEEAIAFEPHYYHYYREHVNFLMPKWYGEEGEAESFANEVAARLGGPEGAFLYFEMASVINCQCGSDEVHMAHMSWPKIKEGYAVLKRLYGTTSLKENRFAYMAYLAKDKAAAQEEFTKIGANWLPVVWKDLSKFQAARSWAFSQ